MRPIAFVSLILFSTGFFIACSKLTQIEPPTPSITGVWTMNPFEISELPAWYVAKTHVDSIVRSPAYTIYGAVGLAISQNVHSYTFTSGNTFSEFYVVNGGISRLARGQRDTGTWALVDSVVNLTISNNHPHKLTYLPATAQLVTDKFRQTAIIENPNNLEQDTVSYMIRLFYTQNP